MSIFYVVVDAIGLETDFTFESSRKGVKELKTPEFHLSDLKFLTIKNSEMEGKTFILHSPSIIKHIMGVQEHSGTLQKKHNYESEPFFLSPSPRMATFAFKQGNQSSNSITQLWIRDG